MKKYIIISIIFFGLQNLKAQTKEVFIKNDSISLLNTFINPLKKKISIRANLSTNINSYSYIDNEGPITLTPNEDYKTALAIDYSFLGFSIGFTPKFLPGNNDNRLKGKSKISSIGFQFKFNRWLQRISFEKKQGFYVKNTSDFIEDWQEGTDPYIQFPGLSIKAYKGGTSYKFNDNFSISAVEGYTQWQLKSAGSFVPSINYDYTIFSLEEVTSNTKDTSNELNVTISPSYFYNFVYNKNWFLSLVASPGLGYNYSKEIEENILTNVKSIDYNRYLYYRLDSTILIGYNSSSFYMGTKYEIKTLSNFDKKNESLIISNNFFEFYLGYRFDAPKFIEKTFQRLKKK